MQGLFSRTTVTRGGPQERHGKIRKLAIRRVLKDIQYFHAVISRVKTIMLAGQHLCELQLLAVRFDSLYEDRLPIRDPRGINNSDAPELVA